MLSWLDVDRQLAADKWSGGSRAWLPLLLDLSCGLSSAAMALRAEPTARRSKSKSSASWRSQAKPQRAAIAPHRCSSHLWRSLVLNRCAS